MQTVRMHYNVEKVFWEMVIVALEREDIYLKMDCVQCDLILHTMAVRDTISI